MLLMLTAQSALLGRPTISPNLGCFPANTRDDVTSHRIYHSIAKLQRLQRVINGRAADIRAFFVHPANGAHHSTRYLLP
jgi:hypothetical protein